MNTSPLYRAVLCAFRFVAALSARWLQLFESELCILPDKADVGTYRAYTYTYYMHVHENWNFNLILSDIFQRLITIGGSESGFNIIIIMTQLSTVLVLKCIYDSIYMYLQCIYVPNTYAKHFYNNNNCCNLFEQLAVVQSGAQ